jgi:sugar lactone lactonase YvrE
VETSTAEVLYRPTDEQLRFLPEGPYSLGDDRLSWVSIQFSPESQIGALNLLNTSTGVNESHPLPGRPGFAFPTTDDQVFIVGLERQVVLYDIRKGVVDVLADEIDGEISGTIINDGVLLRDGVVFGCKDTSFTEHKAGLYFLRRSDRRLFTLRTDQLCSNGKVTHPLGGDRFELLDIDTPTKKVVRYELDTDTGELTEATVSIDLADDIAFPDGMIELPGQDAVVIAMFNPESAEMGHAKRFCLKTGDLDGVWEVPGSPQVTCPQLARIRGEVKLVLTTAAENMSDEKKAEHPNAGCLFVADIDLDDIGEAPRWEL